jgi:GNAT superfamily N-acetyltransferase
MKLYPRSTQCKTAASVVDAAVQNNATATITENSLTVRVKELCERDRRRTLMHFLALSESDRLLRFGSNLPDEMITRYVQRLDFTRDKIFGVLDNDFQLVGVGHLAFMLRDALPTIHAATHKEWVGEFGVSVSESARGIGAGTQLFKRAAIHCRNADIDVLVMQCLATNLKMISIARHAGMEIQLEYGEADAYLKLAPADTASVMREAVDEQVASIDYSIKANIRAANKWLDTLKAS